jgi:hypothetical protein
MSVSAAIADIQARGAGLVVIRRNAFLLASCHVPLAWLLCDFATNLKNQY